MPALAAAVPVSVVLAACGALMPGPGEALPIDDLDLEPRAGDLVHPGEVPQGPVVDVARGVVDGEPFSMTAFTSRQGVCTWTERPGGGGGGCGPVPGGLPGTGPFGTVGGGGGEDGAPWEWSGVVTPDVASVLVDTATGRARSVLVSLEPAGIEGRLFFVFLPADAEVRAVVALAADGSTIGRLELGQPPRPGGGGPVPTPAAPPDAP